ncbi:hypothetical protein DFH06DRAFT_1328322 [Mycena polygramma]|nr:hypothetical protein DFH06DRAFT_1328322 [Mycena polygramma]
MLSSTLASSSSKLELPVLSSANPASDIRTPSPILASRPPDAVIPAPAAMLAPSEYAGLSHGVPSHVDDSGTRRRLGSIPEEEVECTFSPPFIKAGKHTDLGRNVPSEVRKDGQCQKASDQPIPSPRTAAPLKSRLKSTMQKFFNTRKFEKRTLLAIPEAQCREPSAREKGSSNGAQMSSVMLMAAQSILEEDRKFRKKERMSEVPRSSTARLASQVLQVQEEERKERKQARLEKLGAAPKKFVLVF